MADVKVYGADWCPMTNRARAHLDRIGVDYEYIDIEKDPKAAEWVREQNDGKEKKPTILVGGEVLSTPTDEEVDEALAQRR